MESSVIPTSQDGACVEAAVQAEQLLSSAKHGKELVLPGPRHRELSAPGSSGRTARVSSFCSRVSRGPALVVSDLERQTC